MGDIRVALFNFYNVNVNNVYMLFTRKKGNHNSSTFDPKSHCQHGERER